MARDGTRLIDRPAHAVVAVHRHGDRRALGARIAAAFLISALLGYVAGFGAYGFVVVAGDYLAAVPDKVACDNPASRYGWAYEAINYDRADDARLLASSPDAEDCRSQGVRAGDVVRSIDGTPIAGWYIPAAVAPLPEGATVVLVHGGKTNKSGMLEYARPFHDRYNVVILDLRNSGRSGGEASTGGLRERFDLRAMLDWLVATKHPSWIAVMGNSNGGATALAEAVDDSRVRALILDSMHASVERQLGNIVETEHAPLRAWPLAAATVLGVSARIGEDLASVDPVRMIARLGRTPVLLTHGGRDRIDRPGDSLEANETAARAGGVDIEVELCPAATHGQVVAVCAAEWQAWVLEFLGEHGGIPVAP